MRSRGSKMPARYKYVATPKTRDIRASLWLVGRFASPLRRPVDDRFKIGAATNAAFASFFAFQRCKTSWKIAFENSGIVANAISLATPRLSTDQRICGLYQCFHGRPIAPKTEQGCESRKPPPSPRPPQGDQWQSDPLAHPSGSLRFYPINSKGLRASQLLTRPNLGTRWVTFTHPKGSIWGKRL
jgi:hypothetical protein